MTRLKSLIDGAWLKPLALVLAAVLATGCAVGNTYNYRDSDMAIPVTGDAALGLSVVDRRPYVLSGDKPASFIGLQRGGFGNPFNVTTESGRPLAEEVQAALATGLRRRGYTVTELDPVSVDEADVLRTVKASNLARNVVLVFQEWKTDAMMSFGLSYDLILRVLDADGAQLASSSSRSDKENLGSAGMESANAELARRTMASKIEALFRDPSIQETLSSK
jgi:hypothetical protein